MFSFLNLIERQNRNDNRFEFTSIIWRILGENKTEQTKKHTTATTEQIVVYDKNESQADQWFPIHKTHERFHRPTEIRLNLVSVEISDCNKEKPMTIWNYMFKIQHSIDLNQQQKRSSNSFESHCFCFDLVVNNSPKNSITLISMIEWMLCSKDHTRNCLSTSPFFPFSSQQTLHIKYTYPIRNGLMIASHWHQLRPDKLFYFCIKLPIKFENMTS